MVARHVRRSCPPRGNPRTDGTLRQADRLSFLPFFLLFFPLPLCPFFPFFFFFSFLPGWPLQSPTQPVPLQNGHPIRISPATSILPGSSVALLP